MTLVTMIFIIWTVQNDTLQEVWRDQTPNVSSIQCEEVAEQFVRIGPNGVISIKCVKQ